MILTAALLLSPWCWSAPPTPADTKVIDFIDSRYPQTAAMAREIWEYAEPGYLEERSSALLKNALAAEEFTVTPGVAGLPTAFVASRGKGKPVIAILAEFDALPGINQDALPERSPIADKPAGHACGHNLFGTASVQAAIAVAEWLDRSGNGGTIRVIGTPAEEGGSGKVYMVREGLFEDIDIVLNWHPDSKNQSQARTTLANRSAKFRFHGVSSHAAIAPEKARSALDGVEAFNHMVNLMREHLPQETRIHYVITAGGQAPNVVPDFAEVFYYVRHPETERVRSIWQRVTAAAEGAAQGTGTTVDWEIIHGNHPVLINETLGKLVDAKLHIAGGINYTPEEQAFARQIHDTLVEPQFPLGSQGEIQPYRIVQGYGSSDVGDVSMAVPTAGLRIATWVPGTVAHTWQAVAAAGMSIGFKGAQLAAKTMSLTAIELFENASIRDQARAEFENRRGTDFQYEALLGDREPPLDYRR